MYTFGWQWGRTEIPLKIPPPPRSSPERSLTPMDPLSKADRQILVRLRRGPFPRRQLQQTLGRDLPAAMFNHTLKRLASEGYVFLDDGRYCLTPKGATAIECESVSFERPASARGYIEFFGSGHDCCGMPVHFRKYAIAADPGPAAGSCIVTIAPRTRANPLLEEKRFFVPRGGAKAAFFEAVSRLTALPQNQGLFRRVWGR